MSPNRVRRRAGCAWVSILIVSYRSTADLRACLEAIAAQTAFDRIETIVVDNGSPDFHSADVQAAFPWARIEASPTNLTYTGGNNRAFELAQGNVILLLNPDTVLEPAAVERALAHFDARPEMVAQGATLLNADGTLQRYYRRLPGWREVPYVLLAPLFARTRSARRYLMLDDRFGPETEVDQPPGAFLMLRRAALGSFPLLDPGYFNYMSDVELCSRLRRVGKIVVFDDVRCWHRKGGAGVASGDPAVQLRLRHDLTWGVRRFYRAHRWPVRLYVEAWLRVFWLLRLVQLLSRHPLFIGDGLWTARRALRNDPPAYAEPASA